MATVKGKQDVQQQIRLQQRAVKLINKQKAGRPLNREEKQAIATGLNDSIERMTRRR